VPIQQLAEEQLPHMENMGYDVVSPVVLLEFPVTYQQFDCTETL
jgi:hypothetical protein